MTRHRGLFAQTSLTWALVACENFFSSQELVAGLNWYRANIPVQFVGANQLPEVPKLPMPVLGLWSTGDGFLSEEQMTLSARYPQCNAFH